MELAERIEGYLTGKLLPVLVRAGGRSRRRLHHVFRQERPADGPDGQDPHPADPLDLHAVARHRERVRRRESGRAPRAGPGMVPARVSRPRARRLVLDRRQERQARLDGQDHVRPELRHLLHERMRARHRARRGARHCRATPSISCRSTRRTRCSAATARCSSATGSRGRGGRTAVTARASTCTCTSWRPTRPCTSSPAPTSTGGSSWR